MTFREEVAYHMIQHGGWLTCKDVALGMKEQPSRVGKTIYSMFEHDKWYMQRKEESGSIYYKLTGFSTYRSNSIYKAKLENYLRRHNGSHLTISMAQKFVEKKLGCTVASSTVSKYAKRLGVKLTGPGGRNKKEVKTKITTSALWSKALGLD